MPDEPREVNPYSDYTNPVMDMGATDIKDFRPNAQVINPDGSDVTTTASNPPNLAEGDVVLASEMPPDGPQYSSWLGVPMYDPKANEFRDALYAGTVLPAEEPRYTAAEWQALMAETVEHPAAAPLPPVAEPTEPVPADWTEPVWTAQEPADDAPPPVEPVWPDQTGTRGSDGSDLPVVGAPVQADSPVPVPTPVPVPVTAEDAPEGVESVVSAPDDDAADA